MLKKMKLLSAGILPLVLVLFFAPAAAVADLEWTQTKQLRLEESPLDVSVSVDGKWIFVLSPGEILVYSGQTDKPVKRIPVDKHFDRMVFSAPDNSLIVTSSAEKSMKIIQLDVIHAFSLEGLPFKGPRNAPVTLVVFSDYQ